MSDIHLCRLRPGMAMGGQRQVADFLRHHAHAGKAFRLIIAGDLFDFDHHTDDLDERGPEPASLRMLEEILDEFDDVVRAFAEFLEADHEIIVLTGNHDIDLSFPSVREAMRNAIGRRGAGPSALARLSFKQWFHYEHGRAYVEHGLQYDPDNAVAGWLAPFRGDAPLLRHTLGTRWITDFCPNIPEMAYVVDHTRGPLFYLPVLAKLYGWRAPSLWLRYVAFAWRTVLAAGSSQSTADPAHETLRDALAREAGLEAAKLRDLEAIGVPARFGSRLDTGARFHITVATLLPFTTSLCILAAVTRSSLLAWSALVALVATLLPAVLAGDRFHGQETLHLARAAPRVQRVLGVPLVVFGHVHVACTTPLDDGALYINSGTWMGPDLPCHYVRVPTTGTASLHTWPEPG